MKIIEKFLDQPAHIKLSAFWLVIFAIVVVVVEPRIALFLFLSAATISAIYNLIIYFVTK